jgi:hypothetical protein
MLLFLPSSPVRRAQVESYRRIRNGNDNGNGNGNAIGTEDLHKFIMNRVS